MINAVEIKNLSKSYNNGFKLGEISLNIPKGLIIGLIGENGAGKTTLIKSILNIIKIDTGNIKIFDKDYINYENIIKEDIGVVLDNMFFPELLTSSDIDKIMGDIFKNWDSKLYFDFLNKFNLPIKRTIKNLSKGMRKKLEIATALAHHPKLLILDEPTSGLDPITRSEVLDIFQNFVQDEEHTILFSTHITSDLEHIADYIIFIDQGKLVLNENKDTIVDNYGILKCDIDDFNKVSREDYLVYKKNKYSYDFLINNKSKIKKKYRDFVIDNISLEELMILMIKGDK